MKRRKVETIDNEQAFYRWAKNRLYANYLHLGEMFVDLGSGCIDTFDIIKYLPKKLLNIDKDKDIVEQGFRETKEKQKSGIHWHLADLTQPKTFTNLIDQRRLFLPCSIHVFLSNFSLNHLAVSEQAVSNLLEWISTFLVSGGYFVGIFEDAERIIDHVMAAQADPNDDRCDADHDADHDVDRHRSQRLGLTIDESFSDSKDKEFGHKYTIEGSYTSAPPDRSNRGDSMSRSDSYLVFWELLVKLAAAHGLRLVVSEPLSDLYKRYNNPNLDARQKQLAFFNRSFVFQKN